MARGFLKSHKIRAFLFYPLYFLSKFWARDHTLWLFGPMNNAFLDNAKYLFLYVLHNHPEINAYLLSDKPELIRNLKEQKLPVLYKWSFKGLLYGLRARYYIISAYADDINFWTSGGAVVFNLWHGIPLKKIEFDINSGSLAKRYLKKPLSLRLFKPYFYRRPDFVLSTSPEVSRIFAGAFRIKPEQCPPLGYPRTDIFFWEKKRILQHIRQREPQYLKSLTETAASFNHVLLYMPTWRDDRSDFLQKAFPDLPGLNKVLAEQNALLLIKLHPNDASLQTFRDLSHIRSLPAKLDVYPFLPFTSALITDYSSIYFDYLLLRKPIIFYPFDLQEYIQLRALYFDYDQAVGAPVVKSFEQLLAVLADLQNLHVAAKQEKLLQRFWYYKDGGSSKRIVRFLKEHAGKIEK